MEKHKEIYKIDSKGKTRVYFIEQDGAKYRMVTGIKDGNLTRSKWTEAKPKNVGKSNETTGEEQATKEIEARYKKKLEADYAETVEEAAEGPRFIQPMLAEEWDKVAIKHKRYPLIADPKLDGMRMTLGFNLKPTSRKGKDIPTAYHIADDLREFLENYPNIVLDGELYNHAFHDDFNKLMSIARKGKPTEDDLQEARNNLKFYVYDMVDLDNPGMSALERKHWLDANLPSLDSVVIVDYVIVNSDDELRRVRTKNLLAGYEGTITRNPDSPYQHKRTKDLLKIKDFKTEEFKIVDILPGKGNKGDIAGSVVVDVDGLNVGCGIRGSWDYCKHLLDNRAAYIGKDATVRYFDKTEDGSLRFPVVVDINRPD